MGVSRLVCAAACLVVSAVAALGATGVRAGEGRADQIPPAVVFGSERDGTLGIWAASLQGGDPVRLGYGVEPQASPDGTRLLVRNDLSYLGESVLQPDLGKPVELDTAFSPKWSPDGTRIAFVRNNLWVTTPDAGGEQQLALDANQAVWSPDGSSIAFLSGGRTDGLFTLSPGGVATPLTRPGDPAPSSVDWSPNGTQIAYAAPAPDGHDEIYLANADGSRPSQLTASGSAVPGDPAWSPDGSQIAFAQSGRIWRIDAAGTTMVAVTPAGGNVASPTWSPDGRSIAFESRGAKHAEIDVVELASGAVRRLTLPAEAAHRPRWSSARDEIFYSSDTRIRAVAPDGSSRRAVTTGTMPAPSRDGSQLAFRRDGDIWVAGSDGRNAKRVVASGAASAPTWSPSGSIAYLAPRPTGIGVVQLDGGARTTVTNGNASGVSWSPDGRSLLFVAFGAGPSRSLVLHDYTSGSERTIASGIDNRTATWSADGGHVAFLRRKALYVVGSDGAGEHQVAAAPVARFAWAPSANLIAYDQGSPSTSVYVADPGGTDTTKISVSAGGESSFAPAWSPDGRWVAFLHARVVNNIADGDYYNADVEVAAADGSRRQAVTSPFPVGGANDTPTWARVSVAPPPAQPLLVASPPRAPGVSVPPVTALGANGAEAITASADRPSGATLFAWRPHRTAAHVIARPCAQVAHVALTADSFAFTIEFDDIEPSADATLGALAPPDAISETLYVVRRGAAGAERALCRGGRRVPPVAEASVAVHVQAIGAHLLYDTRPDDTHHVLWEITNHRRRQIVAFKDASRATDVGGPTQDPEGRVVVPEVRGAVVFDRMGHEVQHVSSPSDVLGAGVTGTRLVVVAARQLTVFDVRTRRPLLREDIAVAGSGVTFGGIGAGTTAYIAGTAVHVVDVTSGRDVAVHFPGVTDGVRVTLDDQGLFAAYRPLHTAGDARLTFLSTAQIRRLLHP
jgi:Tol biopolymer transport system component